MKLLFVRGSLPDSAVHLGAWSTPCAVVSVCWLFGTSVLFFLPSTSPVTTDNMNYAVLVVLFFVVSGALYWRVFARHTFRVRRSNSVFYFARDDLSCVLDVWSAGVTAPRAPLSPCNAW